MKDDMLEEGRGQGEDRGRTGEGRRRASREASAWQCETNAAYSVGSSDFRRDSRSTLFARVSDGFRFFLPPAIFSSAGRCRRRTRRMTPTPVAMTATEPRIAVRADGIVDPVAKPSARCAAPAANTRMQVVDRLRTRRPQ